MQDLYPAAVGQLRAAPNSLMALGHPCSGSALSRGDSLEQLWVTFVTSTPKVQLVLLMLIL